MALRSRLDPAEKAVIEEKIFAYLRELATYRYCDTLLLYSPIKGELDVNIAARWALDDGKRIAYPITEPSSRTMKFGYADSPGALVRGNLGILEPPPGAELFDDGINTHAICVVPALAFDTDGYRLGYGKGYYDRFLAQFTGVKVGLAPARFVLPRLPRGRYDLAVDVILTEEGVKALGK